MPALFERTARRPWRSIALGAIVAFAIASSGSFLWTKDLGDSFVRGLGIAIGITALNVGAKIWNNSRKSAL